MSPFLGFLYFCISRKNEGLVAVTWCVTISLKLTFKKDTNSNFSICLLCRVWQENS